MARKIKLTPEQIARKAARDARLVEVHAAIADGRAYLDTYCGRRKVTGYRDDTGWAITNNTGSSLNQQSFYICLESIKID